MSNAIADNPRLTHIRAALDAVLAKIESALCTGGCRGKGETDGVTCEHCGGTGADPDGAYGPRALRAQR